MTSTPQWKAERASCPRCGEQKPCKCDSWEILVELYADGRPICNCRWAYYSPCAQGIVDGRFVTGLLGCRDGCSANQIDARADIARRILVDPLTPEQWRRGIECAGIVPVQHVDRADLTDADGHSRDDGEAR